MKNIAVGLLVAATPVTAWIALEAVDAQMVVVTTLIRAPFSGSDGDAVVATAVEQWLRWRIVDKIAAVLFLPVLFGALPIAAFAAIVDRLQRSGRGALLSFYPLFALQLVSMTFTAILLAPAIVALGSGFDDTETALLPLYVLAQFKAGVLTLPVWRRIFERAAAARLGSYFLREHVIAR